MPVGSFSLSENKIGCMFLYFSNTIVIVPHHHTMQGMIMKRGENANPLWNTSPCHYICVIHTRVNFQQCTNDKGISSTKQVDASFWVLHH